MKRNRGGAEDETGDDCDYGDVERNSAHGGNLVREDKEYAEDEHDSMAYNEYGGDEHDSMAYNEYGGDEHDSMAYNEYAEDVGKVEEAIYTEGNGEVEEDREAGGGCKVGKVSNIVKASGYSPDEV
ncbi:hypothetical protein FACS189472_16750 [Alphaproteobacteria bacterium]|nr:hypothetical protein FACS189472_16750 [Alphaproteobacteria bacterium]